MLRSLILACFGFLILTNATPCWAEHHDEKKLVVVASTTQIADFARQVVGDQCIVKCILAPGADPHTYTPTPGDVETVLKADICLQNGLHLEGKNWMGTLAKDAGKPLVTCTDGIKPLKMDYDGNMVNDPHAWFSPTNVSVYINNITKALVTIDPDHKLAYASRAKLYLQQLRTLDAWIKAEFNDIPLEKRILVTSHDAFNYFGKEYGFKNRAPVGWSTGNEVGAGMTPERRKLVVNSIKEFGVKAIFVETSVNPKMIRQIAKEAGVAIGGELYSDSMGEKGSAGESYIGMMRENVLIISQAMR